MHNQKDSAHILAAPPVFFIIPLFVGAIVEYFVPTSLLPTLFSIIVGLLFSWASLPFIILSLRSFYKVKTAFDARRTTTTLLTTGIYKISRNPAYLSLVLFYIGLSFIINGYLFLFFLQFILFRNFVLREKKNIWKESSEASISNIRSKSEDGCENISPQLHLTSIKGIFVIDFSSETSCQS